MEIGNLYYLEPEKKILTEDEIIKKIQGILKSHMEKHGDVPMVVEMSDKNECVKFPKGLKIVVHTVSLPINHVLVGIDER